MLLQCRKLINHSAFRFVLVGILNTLVGTVIMFVCYNLIGFGYWLSSALNYIIASIMSFVLNKRYTFAYTGHTSMALLRFALSIAVCYLLSYHLARWGVSTASQSLIVQNELHRIGQAPTPSVIDNISMATGTILFTIFNYISQRYFVFRRK